MKAAQAAGRRRHARARTSTTALMKDAKADRGARSGPGQRRPGEPDPAKTYKRPDRDMRPQHGPDDALVTIVE
jgi:hypothetical protein